MNLKKIILDTRNLEHPKPLEMAMKALHALSEENYLYMLHRKNPVPLIDLTKEHHFQVLSHEDSDKLWHILIAKDQHVNLDDLLDV